MSIHPKKIDIFREHVEGIDITATYVDM